MARCLWALFATFFAVVPPGFCQCRLEAALVEALGATPASQPDEHDDDHECECGPLKQDCVRPAEVAAPERPGAAYAMAPTPAATGIESADLAVAGELFQRDPESQPLYLTLRALRI